MPELSSQNPMDWSFENPTVEAFYRAQPEQTRRVIDGYMKGICTGSLVGERVQCESIPTYKVNIPSSKLPRHDWPHGLRLVFRKLKGVWSVHIIDMGDHTTSALHPQRSVYADERRKVS